MLTESLTDVAVLMVFFNRPDRFSKVLNSIKIAKPSKLYLYQDGPRNENDQIGILDCRKLIEKINWNCKIFTNFQEQNYGCDPSVYKAIKWMFESEKYGIIIEDDVVIEPTFICFAKEMLEMYAEDYRIGMVCSMNHIKENRQCADSYFFSMESPIWGWATWKRVVDEWDRDYSFLKDKRSLALIKDSIMDKQTLKFCCNHSKKDNYYFETILWKHKWLNSQLSIIPSKNMTCNIGIGGDKSTHYGESIKLLPRKKQKIMFMEINRMEFPLKHPKVIVRDYAYERKVAKIMRPNIFVKYCRGIEKIIRKLFYKLRLFK